MKLRTILIGVATIAIGAAALAAPFITNPIGSVGWIVAACGWTGMLVMFISKDHHQNLHDDAMRLMANELEGYDVDQFGDITFEDLDPYGDLDFNQNTAPSSDKNVVNMETFLRRRDAK